MTILDTTSMGPRLRSLAAAAALGLLTPSAFAADIFAGRKLYEDHCARCHGQDGVPVLPGTPDFTRGQGLMAPDSVLFQGIKDGKGLMPGFARLISEQDILNVLAYSRTLQR